MGRSLDSSRPIMAPSLLSPKRASMRYSTYTTPAPSMHSFSSDTVQAEIADITAGLAKLENKKLASQRFVPSKEKSENLSKLALGAKLERALDRRMKGQDAVMRKKVVKRDLEKSAVMA
ncbi:hypothetical protein VC83_08223 [Pseudogymnoascus destructans]|uniref:Uncharacterized protein n=2 Tax=Pseudogymnoascus destructans TaxID=655981 RepID=L8FYF3_PSED2|nr:uncharacterized protein VC83_08223 [Pseudogymnoascus destructans]ELR05508.1 hypothetical protein GMDG_07430 [Pseudogymnoascus destructans 20631-21]OAF55332.1 hypothetical protein VC83_08223 [Pseudogymnoascus destructans]